MSTKFITKLVALILALTLAISIVPMATISSSAEVSLKSFNNWVTNQLYARCLSQAGSVLVTIGEASGKHCHLSSDDVSGLPCSQS